MDIRSIIEGVGEGICIIVYWILALKVLSTLEDIEFELHDIKDTMRKRMNE